MTGIPLFSVTHHDGRRICVELYDREADAIARRHQITAGYTGRVVLASHELRVGR